MTSSERQVWDFGNFGILEFGKNNDVPIRCILYSQLLAMVFRGVIVLLSLVALSHSQIATDQAIVFLTSSQYNGDLASSNPCQTELLLSSALSAYHTSHAVFPLVADANHDLGDLLPGINDVISASGSGESKNWADTFGSNSLQLMLTDREGNSLNSQTFWSGADMSNNGAHLPNNDCEGFTSNYPGDNGRLVSKDFVDAGGAPCDSTQNVLCAITHLPSTTSAPPTPVPSPSPALALDTAIVFVTSSMFTGDLVATNPCNAAVATGVALAAYRSDYHIFPMVADETHNFDELLAGITTITDSNGIASSYNWANTVANQALGSILTNEHGMYPGTSVFWTGANDLVYDRETDCSAFSSNDGGVSGYTTHSDLNVLLQAIEPCDSAQHVLCAITHLQPAPSASPTAAPVAPVVTEQVAPRLVRGIGGNYSPVFMRRGSHA
jgi:hypothetical protein